MRGWGLGVREEIGGREGCERVGLEERGGVRGLEVGGRGRSVRERWSGVGEREGV